MNITNTIRKAVVPAAVVMGMAGYWQWSSPRANRQWDPRVTVTAGRQSATIPVTVRAEGQLVAYPGAEVIVGTEVGGRIVTLYVKENSIVHKGDRIADVDSREQRAQLDEARAQIKEAEADIRYDTAELARMKALVEAAVTSREVLDRTQRDLDQARAHRELAASTAERLTTVISKTRITAPIDGTVVLRSIENGETVTANTPLVTIADLSKTRIQAEVDEFDAASIKPSTPAVITVEGYPGQSWKGRVEEIPGDVVRRQLKPSDPGQPTDARVLLVKVKLMESTPIKLNQRVMIDFLEMPSSKI